MDQKALFLEFFDEYLQLFAGRMTAASIRFESDVDSAEYINALMFDSNLKAINYIFKEVTDEQLRPDIIQDIARIVDQDSNENGFRRTFIEVAGSNVERSPAKSIYPHIYSLLENYYKVWPAMNDAYLREAYFHIVFLHIHPFEDGNGRVARIITASNLFKLGETPFVIGPQHKAKYTDLIENTDYVGLAELFKKLSIEENKLITSIYEKNLNRLDKSRNK